jgi:hypothetical protein
MRPTLLGLVTVSLLRGLPDLGGHPGAEIAVLGLWLVSMHKRDAGSAERRAVAIENGEVHQRVVEHMRHDRGERLSAVNVGKAIAAAKSGEFWSWRILSRFWIF